MSFIDDLENSSNRAVTENGAVVYATTKNNVLDLFSTIGSLRSRREEEIVNKFIKAYAEDKLLALKTLFYARNIRGGLGERRTFRIITEAMANSNGSMRADLIVNLPLIAKYGRWDDLINLIDTPIESEVIKLLNNQLQEDLSNMEKNKSISLLGKWLPSINTSSKTTRAKAYRLQKAFGCTIKEYYTALSALRRYLKVVEKKMSDNEWTNIDYEAVPSRAMSIYRNAFERHNPEAFTGYVKDVKQGTKKVNAATLYPYDILEKCGFSEGWTSFKMNRWDELLEEQWKALPNYVEGERNILVVADTSGSMSGRPMCTSVGLALYFAERNHGDYKDKFMTFSSRPMFVTVKGNTLPEKVSNIESIVDDTNLEAVFNLILETAVVHQSKQEDLPEAIVIITDGEFNYMVDNWGDTYHQSLVNKFAHYGYSLPNIIYWNVDSRSDKFLAISDTPGVMLASGQSTSTFKSILNNIGTTPEKAMLKVLDDYSDVKLADNV